jgi:hypothetical protein
MLTILFSYHFFNLKSGIISTQLRELEVPNAKHLAPQRSKHSLDTYELLISFIIINRSCSSTISIVLARLGEFSS